MPQLLPGPVQVLALACQQTLNDDLPGSVLITLARVLIAFVLAMLAGYAAIAQSRWAAWLRKQRLNEVVPTEFSSVLKVVTTFADPIVIGAGSAPRSWDTLRGTWR